VYDLDERLPFISSEIKCRTRGEGAVPYSRMNRISGKIEAFLRVNYQIDNLICRNKTISSTCSILR
jgi:hypothetical protein